jgi:hypothetical protein
MSHTAEKEFLIGLSGNFLLRRHRAYAIMRTGAQEMMEHRCVS